MKVLLVCNDVVANLRVHSLLLSKLYSGLDSVQFVQLGVRSFMRGECVHTCIEYEGVEYNVVKIHSIKALASLLSEDVIVISFFSEKIKDWLVFLLIRIYQTPLIYISNIGSAFNFSFRSRTKLSFVGNVKAITKSIISKSARLIPHYIFNFFIVVGIFRKIDIFYFSNRQIAGKLKNSVRYNRVITINSAFYDLSLDKKYDIGDEFIVFLDSMVPYHGDQIKYGYRPIAKDIYYDKLNELFEYLEKITGKKVIICLHPRYDENNAISDFRGRLAAKNKSQYYVAKASLVLFHDTSAINSAILYNKKIIQLTSVMFNDFWQNLCGQYFNKFKMDQFDFTSDNDFEKLNQIVSSDKSLDYTNNYLNNYIISSGVEGITGYSQIIEDLSTQYSLAKK